MLERGRRSFASWGRAAACVASAFLLASARAATPPPGFVETVVVPGNVVAAPTAIAYEPGSGSLFVLEKGDGTRGGVARVLRRDGATGAISTALTIPCMASRGERGLLGIAFDPDYEAPAGEDRFVYLFYTRWITTSGTCAIVGPPEGEYNRVVRYRESGGVLSGEELLLPGPRLGAQNHNGGTLRFGADGTLYVSMGDNDSAGLGQPYSRDLADLRGKILRIRRDGTVPPDNPFVGLPDARPEVWAWGLRNPFRFSIDPASDTLYIADVGEGSWEEIDAGVPGADYGYPCYEGPEPFVTCEPAPPPGSDTKPIYAYGHQGQTFPVEGNSITGGPVYRASSFPADYHGSYFFGDYADGWIRRGRFGPDGKLTDVEMFLPDATNVVDMAVSPAGCLAWLGIGGAGAREVCFVGGDNGQPHAAGACAPASGLAPLATQCEGGASFDPDGDTLTYDWSFGDGGQSSLPSPAHTYVTNGVYQALLSVDDGRGSANSSDTAPPLRIVVGNRAPTAAITGPAIGSTYDAGDTIAFAGQGSDPEDGTLPPEGLAWTVVFHHGDHTHPFMGPTGGAETGSFTIPTDGEGATDVFFRIRLAATDSGAPLGAPGRLSHESSRDVHPNVGALAVAAQPTGFGLTLAIDQVASPAPWSKPSVVGYQRSIAAPSPQVAGGATWEFESWSDGGAREHGVATPAVAAPFIATFACVAGCGADLDGDGVTIAAGDCDDTRAAVRPGAVEGCDGLDNDCDGAVDERAPPPSVATLRASKLPGGVVRWDWTPVRDADRYDVVGGAIIALRVTQGDWSRSISGCLQYDDASATMLDAVPLGPGGRLFRIVRPIACATHGSFDSGAPSQVASRDAGIDASPNACP